MSSKAHWRQEKEKLDDIIVGAALVAAPLLLHCCFLSQLSVSLSLLSLYKEHTTHARTKKNQLALPHFLRKHKHYIVCSALTASIFHYTMPLI